MNGMDDFYTLGIILETKTYKQTNKQKDKELKIE